MPRKAQTYAAGGLGTVLPEPPERTEARKIVLDWMATGPAKEWWAPGREEQLVAAIEKALTARRNQV